MMALALPTRFVLVGLVCAGLHNAILIVGDHWKLHYAVSCVISYAVVVVLGFALHVSFTFRQDPSLSSFWRYALSMAANYPLTLALLFVMCDVLAWPVVIAAPAATVLMMAWNFSASRWAIVGTQTPTHPTAPSRLP